MIQITQARHAKCKARAQGADYYFFAADGKWECYAHTANKLQKLNLPGVLSVNWEDDPLEPEYFTCSVAEKDIANVIEHLTKHGSVALIEASGALGAERETLYYCICVVPKLSSSAGAVDLDDLI